MSSTWRDPVPNHVEPIARRDSLDTLRVPFPSYSPRAGPEDVGDLHQYPPGDTHALNSMRSVIPRAESRLSNLGVEKSLPIAVCATLVLNVPLYIQSSVATGAWDTRAVEYAIGSGCVGAAASFMLYIERRCYGDTLLEWKSAADRDGWSGTVELRFLLAYTAALFSSVPRLGDSIRSLSEKVSGEGLAVLIQAVWGVMPALLVVRVMIWWMRPRTGGPIMSQA